MTRRRARGTGSVKAYRTAAGTPLWGITYTHQGKARERRGYTTEAEAYAALPAFIEAIKDGTWDRIRAGEDLTPPAEWTLDKWVDDWMIRRGGLQRWSPSTKRVYRALYESRVKPEFGDLPIGGITAMQVERWCITLDESGLAAESVTIARRVLTASLGDAHQKGLIPANPCAELPKAAKPVHDDDDEDLLQVWTLPEQAKFLQGTSGTRLHPLWWLMLTTGLRRGEALALRWSDVDLDAGRVTVRRTMNEWTGTPTFGPPKTKKSRRTVEVDADTVAVLREWRRQVLEERLRAGVGADDSGCVFVDPMLQPWRPERVRRTFREESDRLGMPPIRLHSLRHCHVALLIAQGHSLKVIADRLGHSTISTTADVYAHLIDGQDRQVASGMVGVFTPSVGGLG